MPIEIKTSDISLEQLENFLIKVDKEFERPLSSRVGNMADYAKKLFTNSEIVVAFDNNKLAGLAATYMNNISTNCAFLAQLVVLKEFRRRNIGKSLLDFTIALARKKGMKKIRLEVDYSAIGAMELYKQIGFDEEIQASADSVLMVKAL